MYKPVKRPMSRYGYIALAVLLLTACTARQTQTYDAYGNEAYSITCNIAERVLCLEQAQKTCPRGYHLIDQDDSGYLFNSILIRCKP